MKKPLLILKIGKACVTLLLLMPFVFFLNQVQGSTSLIPGDAALIKKVALNTEAVFKGLPFFSSNERVKADLNKSRSSIPVSSVIESNYSVYFPAIPAAPVVTCPGNKTAVTESGLCTADVSGLTATISDPDGDITTLRWTMTGATTAASPAAGINNLSIYTFNEGVTTMTYTVIDALGTSASCSFTITVNDNQAPVINCPANIVTTYTEGDCGAAINPGTATATDNCGVLSVTGMRSDGLPMGDPFAPGTTTITWTATDVNSLTSTCAQTVRITEGVILTNYSFVGAAAYPVSPNYNATGISCEATSTEPFNVLSTMGTITGSLAFVENSVANPSIYMDPSNGTNTRYWQFHLSGDSLYKYRKFQLYVQARRGSRAAQAINFSYSTDPVSYTANGSMSMVFSNTWYEKVVDWSAVDLINNPSNLYIRLFASNGTGGAGDNRLFIDNFQVIGIDGPLARPNDVTTPENTDVTVAALHNDYYGCYGPSATNAVSLIEYPAQGTVVLNADSTFTYSPNPNVNGDDSFVYRICDAAGNCDTSIVRINIAPVNYTPTISCPGNVYSGTDVGICGAVANDISANIFDLDGNIVSLTWAMTGATTANSPATGINNLSSYVFNFGHTDVTYIVTDADGLSASCSFTVDVYDSENPSIICPPDTTIAIANCKTFASGVTLTPPQIDDPCGYLAPTNDAPAQFPLGDTPVIWTVYDINGNFSQCGQIVTVVLAPPMSLTMSMTPVNCHNGNDGTATVSVANGTPPYSYSWNTVPAQTTATATNLTAGNYTVTVYDADSCSATASITVTQPATALAASLTNIVNVICYGDASGSVTATASGGTSPYQFSIDSINYQPSGIFNGLTAGNYSMFVRDANGCDTTISFTITQPDTALTVVIDTFNDILCAGQSNGSATALVTGGTTPYSYSWNTVPPQTTATATGLTAGTYIVTVDDANGCGPVTATVTIDEPLPITATASALPIKCPGDSTTVTIAASGGTGTLVYTFDGVTQTGNGIFTGIPAGTYNWSVTDSLGCGPVTGTLSVTEPDTIDATIAVTTPIDCAGGTATVTITATGGTAPYTYIFNGVTQTGSGVFAGIPASTGYLWSVTDGNGCSTVAGTFDVTEPDTLDATAVETTPVPCVGGTATVTIFATGGTPAYTYTLNGISQVGNGVFTGIPAGAGLAWSVTDANGCGPVTGTIDITEPPIPMASASVTIPIPCVGGTATVTVIASNGMEPYTFTFNGVTQVGNGVFTGILAGTYNWSVTDANGCGPVNGTLSVAAPPIPAASAAVTTPILCNGGTATVTITAVNGVAPYTYTFNGVTQVGNGVYPGIPAGTGYAWSVYDANGCGPVTGLIDVTEPDTISATATVTSPVICIGATGTVTIVANGGTVPYTFTFNGVTQVGNGVFTGIYAGNGYVWSVDDVNGCGPVTGTLDITEPPIPAATAAVTGDILCAGGTATVTLTASSGTAPYTFTFNGLTQVGNGVFTGIPAGIGYVWTVYDANGCGPVTGTLDITEPLPLTATAAVTSPVICVGGTATITISASGGTSPYSYTLNGITQAGDSVFTGIPAGTYTWSVTDANNCGPVTGTITVDVPPIPAATAYVSSPVPCNGGTASVTISAVNGATPYTYTFNGITQTGDSIFTGIPAGTGYPWSVTDANGCGPVTGLLDVTEPPVLTASITAQSTNICIGDSTGFATVTPLGGTPGYTYLWNTVPPQTTQTAINLPAGTFTVIVTDTNGCTANTSATITEIEPIIADAGPSQLLCNADVTFLVGNDPQPGIGSWTLISGPNNPTIFPPTGSVAVVAGLIPSPIPYIFSYSIDHLGCVRSDTLTVTNFNPPTPAYAGIDQAFCSTTGNESVVLTGNTPVFGTGLWTQMEGPSIAVISDPLLPTTNVSGLTYGTYAFQWMISNGICQVTDDVVNVTVNAPPTAYAGEDDTICDGASITLNSSLAANYTTLHWTTSGTGVFDDPSVLHPVYSPSATDVLNGTVALTLTAGAVEPCEDASDQMILTIVPLPAVNAGEDGTTCQNEPYTVSGAEALNCSSISWSSTGSGTLSNTTTLTPTYSPAIGESGIIYLIIYGTGNSACGSASDTMALQVNSPAIAYAGQDETVCGNSPVTLGTSFANYYSSLLWTTSGTGFFNDPTMLHPAYIPSITDIQNGTVALTLTASGLEPCSDASDQMILTLVGLPSVYAGPDAQACQDMPYTVAGAEALNCVSFVWTTTGTGTISNENTLTPTYTPAIGETGTISLILTGIGFSSCGNVADTMLLQINLPVEVNAGPDAAVCQGETYSVAGSSAANYTVLKWTTSGTGSFDDSGILNPVYTPSPNDLNDGFVYLTLTAGAYEPCTDAADEMKLTLNKPALVNAGPDASVCMGEPFTVSGAAAQMFTSILWTSNGSGTISDPGTLSPTYTPATGETGQVTLTLTASSSDCGDVSDEMILTINTTATANAGADIATCDVTPIQIIEATAVNYTSLFWTSNGSGSFSDPILLNPVYTPSTADVNIGMVVLTLNATGVGGCGDTTDQLILTLVPLPEAEAGVNGTICQGNSFTVSGASATAYATVQWSVVPSSAGTLTDPTTFTPTFTPAADFSGIATLILSVQGESACGSSIISDEMYVTVKERPVISAGPDQTIQPGATALLNGSASGASGFYGWSWQPADMVSDPAVSAPFTVPLYTETSFTLSVLDMTTGCVSSDNITVFISETGSGIKAVADFDTTLVNTPTIIAVLGNDINPDDLPLNVSFCSFPVHGIVIINSDNTITYSPYPGFEGDDSFCYQICTSEEPVMCSDTIVYIHVKQPNISDLFIFNGISPNRDGNNEVWKIRGIENYPDNNVTIYNRWGDVIRKISDYNNTTRSWDGTNDEGKLMPNGTYFYVLEIEDLGIRKGWILIRGEE